MKKKTEQNNTFFKRPNQVKTKMSLSLVTKNTTTNKLVWPALVKVVTFFFIKIANK